MLAADDARSHHVRGAPVELELVRIRVDLPGDEDVVALQDLRDDVRVEAPSDVVHHVRHRHQRFHEIIATRRPLGEGGDIARHTDCHVLNYLRQSQGEIGQPCRQFGRRHDRVGDGSSLCERQDTMNQTW